MFNIKTVKALRNQLKALTIGNEAVANSNKSLLNQRDALVKENNDLRKQIRGLRYEYNETLEAKETERRELCDQLANANDQLEATKKELEQARCTIDKLQAKVARKGCPRDEKGHFIKKDK